MAKDLYDNSPEAKEMIKTADEAVGANLSHIMFNGPEDLLKQTEFTQPAIFSAQCCFGFFNKDDSSRQAAAGHSLGEYSALVSAGAIQFYDAIKLVRERGKAMQQSGIDNPGTMAAILSLNPEVVEEACREASAEGIVQCANFNSPGQIVISGSIPGVKKGMEICKAKGAKLVKGACCERSFSFTVNATSKG